MHGRIWMAAVATALLAACARHDAMPDGTTIIDHSLVLVRGLDADAASREFTVTGDSVVVAFADELKLRPGR